MTDPRVTDELREAAAEAIVPDVRGAGYEYPAIDGARGAIDHLVDGLGWGPKPAVDAQRLNDLVTACTMSISLNPLTEYLEQAGIEVIL